MRRWRTDCRYALAPDRRLTDRYRLDRELGQRGMAAVYLAHECSTSAMSRSKCCSCTNDSQRPRRMLAHEWLVALQRYLEQRHVIRRADVAEHHGRIPSEPTPLRALHRAPLEARTELVLRHREELACEGPRILWIQSPARRERGLSHLTRERHVPRAHLLGDVSTYRYCASACDRNARAKRQIRRKGS